MFTIDEGKDSFKKASYVEQQNRQLANEYGISMQKKQFRRWNPKEFPQNQLPRHIKNDPFLWKVFKRLHYEDRNVLIIVVGETGAGKSCSAINLARKLDITPLGEEKFEDNFILDCDERGKPSPANRVVFSASDFMRLVKSNLPKGSLIVWDEAGIGNDNTTWYEKKSRLVKHVMQTFRKQNLGLIMTVPDEESVTLSTRRLIHCIIDVYSRTSEFANLDIVFLQRNRKNKVTYRKHVVYEDPVTGQKTKLMDYRLEKLPSSIEKKYNKLKDRVLDNLYDFYSAEMAEMDKLEGFEFSDKKEGETNKLKPFNVVECVELVQQNINKVLDEKGELNRDKVIYFLGKRGFDCNTANARTVMNNVEVDGNDS